MSVEAMKQALDALEDATTHNDSAEKWRRHLTAMDALRQAIEQAERQEPVACQHKRYTVDEHEQTGTCYDCGAQGRMRFVVYEPAPPKREWQGLTDEEIEVLYEQAEHHHGEFNYRFDHNSFARALEAKLKEKNNG